MISRMIRENLKFSMSASLRIERGRKIRRSVKEAILRKAHRESHDRADLDHLSAECSLFYTGLCGEPFETAARSEQ